MSGWKFAGIPPCSPTPIHRDTGEPEVSKYLDPVASLRTQVKDMQWQAEKKRREARELELMAATIFDQSIALDLLADKIERAQQQAHGSGAKDVLERVDG